MYQRIFCFRHIDDNLDRLHLGDCEYRQIAGHIAWIIVTRRNHSAHRGGEHTILTRVSQGATRVSHVVTSIDHLRLQLVNSLPGASAYLKQFESAVIIGLHIFQTCLCRRHLQLIRRRIDIVQYRHTLPCTHILSFLYKYALDAQRH